MRNRRRIQRRGPLVIYGQDLGITRAFRNIPGITLLNVNRLNVLKIAPGKGIPIYIFYQGCLEQRSDIESIILYNPCDVVNQSVVKQMTSSKSSWTYQGKAVPFSKVKKSQVFKRIKIKRLPLHTTQTIKY